MKIHTGTWDRGKTSIFSDYLFVLARYCNHIQGQADVPWTRWMARAGFPQPEDRRWQAPGVPGPSLTGGLWFVFPCGP